VLATNLALWAAWPTWIPRVLNILLLLVGVFLILLILIQRGKGGGLAGALGGAGGSSAFGTRAGDTFTRITIYVAAIWILLIMFTIKSVQQPAAKSTPAEVEQLPVDNSPGEPS
jgi:preprotein translocase subunit SecG